MSLVRSFPRYEPFTYAPGYFWSIVSISVFFMDGAALTMPTGYFKTMARWFGGSVAPMIHGGRRRGLLIFGGSTPGPNPNAFQPELLLAAGRSPSPTLSRFNVPEAPP